MISVSEVVEGIIKESPFIEEGLREEIINLSAYARKIHPRINQLVKKDVEVGAIIVALRRLSLKISNKLYPSQVTQVLKNLGDLTLRSNLVEFTFANSDYLIDKEKLLFHKIGENKGLFCNLSIGVTETTIIASKDIENLILNIFRSEKLIKRLDGITSITIKLPKENVEIPGIYYVILKQLAWSNINLVEAFSTYTELTLFFREEDIDKAFATIKMIYN